MLSTTSTSLRQLLTGIKHLVSNNPDKMLYFHLVPDHACKPSDCHYSKEMQEEIVQSVYDRIGRPTYKMLSRQLHGEKENMCKNFKAPAFTLARSLSGSVSLDFQVPERISSVSDRHMLLHVGFCVTENKCWLIAMCLDERHEMQEIGIWKLDTEHTVASILWDFAMKFAARANIEWRVVFANLGRVSERELEGASFTVVLHIFLILMENIQPGTNEQSAILLRKAATRNCMRRSYALKMKPGCLMTPRRSGFCPAINSLPSHLREEVSFRCKIRRFYSRAFGVQHFRHLVCGALNGATFPKTKRTILRSTTMILYDHCTPLSSLTVEEDSASHNISMPDICISCPA